ncbi:EscR/YscR/HrcR family type III secretion system export apparatus protein [Mesorhizobium sp. M1A.F.Ca.IN.020.06.1.1]|uniref:type III secretion system export apparatus subunit SctR n=1 Tax=unclassified Mesorhizobium TaxID=325217 RepID=UPI000FCB7835|nr:MULTISPECIES: type III secretion system export apparatus subunit SctR [unclassified Mesorhizobium]RUV81133.1 EscR/YscR/HrcR family type III secretion system export apparatus protein [Mesorhizobium sp. M1A.F.Ca.IN.020.32.1.1]RUW29052.1 EscR/YscR/HrcR family type III secretion system export apparatus protein [Mesorhizobium sp. M1A.F.Ca.IN.020.06.1.1]RUW03682.1 EscR/YscR/HrcR family type III secretion system export apparatus protein [Mesorhizobium sp. M1A.F.Ca.IN.022.05.2.1]RWF82311.1 MAG: EscR
MNTGLPDPVAMIALIGALAVVPFLAITVTSYVKLVVVFGLIRNALGIQNIPPNMALNAVAILLSVYIMQPAAKNAYEAMRHKEIAFEDLRELVETIPVAIEPFRNFLLKNTSRQERQFFANATRELWSKGDADAVTDSDFVILIPAFITSELADAFKIGFLLFLPFIIIDLVISNILLAMGMMMVSPMTISLPFKLFLFVSVNGWQRLIHGLVLSYAVPR